MRDFSQHVTMDNQRTYAKNRPRKIRHIRLTGQIGQIDATATEGKDDRQTQRFPAFTPAGESANAASAI